MVNTDAGKINSNLSLFNLFIQDNPDILAILSADGTIIQYNDKLMAIFGCSVDHRLENINICQILTPESAAAATRDLTKITSPDYISFAKYEIKTGHGKFGKHMIAPEIHFIYSMSPCVITASIVNSETQIRQFFSDAEASGPANLGETAPEGYLLSFR